MGIASTVVQATTLCTAEIRDLLRGDDGDDVIYGGHARDAIFGGAGADTYVFLDGETENDIIYDFSTTEDKLDLTSYLSAAGYTGSNAITDGYIVTNVSLATFKSLMRLAQARLLALIWFAY